MKKCPYCGAEYPDGTVHCAIDQTPLDKNYKPVVTPVPDDPKGRVKNPRSLKRPIYFGLTMGCVSLFYSLGYRGRYHRPVAPLSFVACVAIFICVAFVSFSIAYVARNLGIPIDRNDR